MKLKATLTLIAASLFLAACDQSGSAAKENAKAETAKPSLSVIRDSMGHNSENQNM